MNEEKNFLDEVVQGAVEFGRDVVAEVVRRYPQPPGRVKLTEREQLRRYSRLTPLEMQGLIKQQGRPVVEKYISEMERLRQKYGGV